MIFDKLKELTKDTAIYGISTMVGRFLNFVLVPFYTNVFLPDQFGIQQVVYAYIGIFNILFIYGMDSAYLKYAAFKDIGDEKDNFSTPYISIFFTSLVISGAIILFKNPISFFLEIPEHYRYLIILSAIILFIDANAVIPFLKLRLDRKAKLFSIFKTTNIVVNIAFNLFLILFLKWGIEAIFVSNLLASLASYLLLLPTILKNLKLKFHKELYKRLLKFGLPYLPAGFAVMLVQVVDVPILQRLTDIHTVGVYKAVYKLGIFMMLFVNMFQYAWQPFFLQNAKEENAKQLFSKVLTYFSLAGSIIFVVLSLFINNIVKIEVHGYSLIGSSYWSGLNIVPIILLAYLFNGLYVIFSAGIYIEEKSIYVPIVSGLGAAVNVAVNFFMIPVWGIMGAAFATLASYLVMAAGYYIVTQKFYHINYENSKIIKIFTISILIVILYYILLFSGNLNLIYKSFLLLSFIIYLIIFVIDKDEFKFLKKKILRAK